MSALEKLTRTMPKPSLKSGGSSAHGKLLSTDVAAACAGMPGYFMSLMLAKYCWPESDLTKAKVVELMFATSKLTADIVAMGYPQAQAKSIACSVCCDFVSSHRCPTCDGRGFVNRKNRARADCKDCAGTGKSIGTPSAGLHSTMLAGLYELEDRAANSIKNRLA